MIAFHLPFNEWISRPYTFVISSCAIALPAKAVSNKRDRLNFLAIFITAIIVSGIKGTHINNTNATLKLINDTTTNNVSGANAL